MVLENVSWTSTVALQVGTSKRRKIEVQWPSEDLPNLPVLVNPKALKAHTRLTLYVDPPPAAPAKPGGQHASGVPPPPGAEGKN